MRNIRKSGAGRATVAAVVVVLAFVLLGGAFLVGGWGGGGGVVPMPVGPAGGSAATTGTPDAGASGEAGGGAASPARITEILDAVDKYLSQNELSQAETVLQGAIGQFPTTQEFYVSYGDLLMAKKDTRGAYAQYERALAIGPRLAKLEFTAGTLANMNGELLRAEEHYSAARTADRANPQYPLFLAQVQIKKGELDAAQANLLHTVKLDPENAVAWGTMAEISLRQGRASMARQHIEKARKIDPQGSMWRLMEARVLNETGESEKALEALLSIPEAERRSKSVMGVLAVSYGALKRPGDAAAMYVAAAERETGDGELAIEAAQWLERAGRKAEAAAWAERAGKVGHPAGAKMAARLRGNGAEAAVDTK
jgi:predicted Zn-dependent protease